MLHGLCSPLIPLELVIGCRADGSQCTYYKVLKLEQLQLYFKIMADEYKELQREQSDKNPGVGNLMFVFFKASTPWQVFD